MNIFNVSHLHSATHGVHGWNFWHDNDSDLPLRERTVSGFGYGFKGTFYGVINVGNESKPNWLLGGWEMDLGHPRWFIGKKRTYLFKKIRGLDN